MKEKLKEYVEKKEKLDKLDAQIKAKKAEHKAEIVQIQSDGNYEDLKDRLDKIQNEIKEQVLNTYNETGEKNTPYGIKVQQTNEMSYDADKAFAWAKEHGLFLTLDTKVFETFAKSTKEELSFITKGTGAKVTWPSKVKLED